MTTLQRKARRLTGSRPEMSIGALALLVAAIGGTACIGQIGDGGDGQGSGVDNHPTIGPDGRYICDKGPYPTQSFARRLTISEYQNVIRDVFGAGTPASSKYPGSYGKSATGFSTEPALYTVGDQTVETLMTAAEDVAESVAGNLNTMLPCAADANATADCAGQLIDSYVQKAYRRPVTDDERAALLATYQDGRDSGAKFDEAVAMMISHALQSPQFLYIVEAAAPGGRELDGYEIASRLSFYLWETIPDQELLAKAADGTLNDPDVRKSEALRMLADPKAEAVLHRFFREWTQTTDIQAANKDPSLVPGFNDADAASMSESFDRFASDQGRNGTLSSLLTSQDMWVNANMASFVGVSPPSDWTKVTLDNRYSGLLTQPLFLASAAHYGDTSYVFRGRFVRKRLLCADLGSPPADAQTQFNSLPKPVDPTGKDLSSAVTSTAACAGCHVQMDPAGLSLENFGALGEYRGAYPSGKAIDPSGTLLAVGSDNLTFNSYSDMLASLADNPATSTCFGRQIVRFAMSREDTMDDGCASQGVGDAVAAQQGTLSDGIVSLTTSSSFIYRRD